jgi:hypothetical protein
VWALTQIRTVSIGRESVVAKMEDVAVVVARIIEGLAFPA